MPRGLEVQPEEELGAVAWMASKELGGVGGVGTHSGDARFLVVAHTPIHGSYDEDVFSLGLTVQQGGGGELTCRRAGCEKEGLGGQGEMGEGGKGKERRWEREENRMRENMKERCLEGQMSRQCACMCAHKLGAVRRCSRRLGRALTPWELEPQSWAIQLHEEEVFSNVGKSTPTMGLVVRKQGRRPSALSSDTRDLSLDFQHTEFHTRPNCPSSLDSSPYSALRIHSYTIISLITCNTGTLPWNLFSI